MHANYHSPPEGTTIFKISLFDPFKPSDKVVGWHQACKHCVSWSASTVLRCDEKCDLEPLTLKPSLIGIDRQWALIGGVLELVGFPLIFLRDGPLMIWGGLGQRFGVDIFFSLGIFS